MSEKPVIPFAGTKQQEEQLNKVIAEHKSQKGALMPVLQAAQDIYGYMPEEVQRMIAAGMEVSLSEVFGIVTFYSQFSLTPKGKYQIKVCMGTACYVVGAGQILERFERELDIKDGETTSDMMFSVDGVRCIGACGLAPVITISEDVHGRINEGMVPDILSQYKS